MISSLYKKHSITFFYLMLLLVFSHSFISAQTPDMPFNIYLKQASLKEFTAKIEQLSEYSFIYGEEVVLKHPITLDLKETPLTTILQTAFIKQDISFVCSRHHRRRTDDFDRFDRNLRYVFQWRKTDRR